MILTLMSNKARIEQAVEEATAKATAKATAEATAKANIEQHRLWDEWNRRREEAVDKGLDFNEPTPEPPPGFHRNGKGGNCER